MSSLISLVEAAPPPAVPRDLSHHGVIAEPVDSALVDPEDSLEEIVREVVDGVREVHGSGILVAKRRKELCRLAAVVDLEVRQALREDRPLSGLESIDEGTGLEL
mmetsp:Transcript_15210/g.62247  ORF Transcript_15210/g.62247 Transcript_15210/m.62247 type:complete len:105 (-) Transcript_15210:117-431(-)